MQSSEKHMQKNSRLLQDQQLDWFSYAGVFQVALVVYLDGVCNVETLLHAWDVKLEHTQIFTLHRNCSR